MISQQNLRDALYYIELLSKIVLRVFDSALILYKDEKSAPRKTQNDFLRQTKFGELAEMVTIEFFLQVVSDSMRYKIAVCDDPDADRSYVLNMVHAWSACAGHTVLYCSKTVPFPVASFVFF